MRISRSCEDNARHLEKPHRFGHGHTIDLPPIAPLAVHGSFPIWELSTPTAFLFGYVVATVAAENDSGLPMLGSEPSVIDTGR